MEIKYYAHVDGRGQLKGWYNTGIYLVKDIPTPNIEISKEVWKLAVANNHNKINDDGTTESFDFRTAEEKAQQEIFFKKAEINRQLSTLTVTTSSGNTFDAYIQARQDMADAILASSTLGVTETAWRMADNSEVLITLDELKEAHALAIQEYARIKGIVV